MNMDLTRTGVHFFSVCTLIVHQSFVCKVGVLDMPTSAESDDFLFSTDAQLQMSNDPCPVRVS